MSLHHFLPVARPYPLPVRPLLANGRRPKSWRVAFTLIELLVVVSVIALLISILLPALKAARGTAQQAVCASNLKQIVLAQTLYADDYGGVIIGSSWFTRIRPYIGDPQYKYFRAEVMVCPSDPTQGGEGAISDYNGLEYFNAEYKRRSYGVNAWISGTHNPTPLYEIRRASKILWYGDSEWWHINSSQISNSNFGGKSQIDWLMSRERHREIEPLGFVDGHVDTSIKIDSLYPGQENDSLWHDGA